MTTTATLPKKAREHPVHEASRRLLNILSSPTDSPLVDQYLNDQRTLNAAEKFAQAHASETTPLKARYYRDLIPVAQPNDNQQYAFEVDLDKCSGCKACVTACNSLNGLDPDEAWRSVGLLHGATDTAPVIQHVTTACHHCLDPACATGCPVNAYEKDPHTGIVHHLDDQCIGCQYCVLTCPFDVPVFSKSRGIVRKCDMCSDRLGAGEAPACVQACPTEAIKITLVDQKEVVENNALRPLVPGAPPGHVTFPTTRYLSATPHPPNLLPADYHTPKKEHDHMALVVMLVLTQLSVGMYCAQLAVTSLTTTTDLPHVFHSWLALGVGLLALGASVFHLGRPLYAFRAMLGLRHSWLSREILAFGLFAAAALVYSLAQMNPEALPTLKGYSIVPLLPPWLPPVAGWLTAITGLLGVYCSVMVYHVTKRTFWLRNRTGPRFFGTTALLGVSGLLMVNVLMRSPANPDALIPLTTSLWVLTGIKLALEASVFSHLSDRHNSSLKRTARLHWEVQRTAFQWRVGCGVVGGVLFPLLLGNLIGTPALGETATALLGSGAFVLCLAGEFLERYLFFTAVVALKMPGAK